MTYICYAYIVTPATLVPMGGTGVYWCMSTPAQQFSKYEIYYDQWGFLGVCLPWSNTFQYAGLCETVFPGITSPTMLLTKFRVAIEVWACTNMKNEGIDLYSRTLVAGAAIMPRYCHWVLSGIGSEPVNWPYARFCEFRGVYDVFAPPPVQMRARL